jgi:hypothetical protein
MRTRCRREQSAHWSHGGGIGIMEWNYLNS